jgi:hypothetical protein
MDDLNRKLEYSVRYSELFDTLVPQLLSLGAEITCETLCMTHPNHVEWILERIPDTKIISLERCALSFDVCFLHILIDWGVKVPIRFTHFHNDAPGPLELRHYASLSDLRVQECRKALLALIRLCDRRLRGVILCIAKQVWASRGPDGCGPRGHLWWVTKQNIINIK